MGAMGWRGVQVELMERFKMPARGIEGEDAKRAIDLLGERARAGRLTLRKIALRTVKR